MIGAVLLILVGMCGFLLIDSDRGSGDGPGNGPVSPEINYLVPVGGRLTLMLNGGANIVQGSVSWWSDNKDLVAIDSFNNSSCTVKGKKSCTGNCANITCTYGTLVGGNAIRCSESFLVYVS